MTDQEEGAGPPEADETEGPPMPGAVEFLFDTPLYKAYDFNPASFEHCKCVAEIQGFDGKVDAFCPACGSQATFRGLQDSVDRRLIRGVGGDHYFRVTLECTRNEDHTLDFWFLVFRGTIRKVGQYPSLADLQEPELRKYRAVLDSETHRELVRGVRLSASGVGVGAFVYLRRVFERLRDDAHELAKQDADWDDQAYAEARGVPDQIRLLKNHLPQFLVDHPQLYGILSTGVHKLSEDECLKHFPVVRQGIELILEQKLQKKREQQKVEEASRAIQNAGFQLTDGNEPE